MRSVGIKVLNSRLSEYVRVAASGETVLITDRDRIVAELGPPHATRSPLLADALLADAVAERLAHTTGSDLVRPASDTRSRRTVARASRGTGGG